MTGTVCRQGGVTPQRVLGPVMLDEWVRLAFSPAAARALLGTTEPVIEQFPCDPSVSTRWKIRTNRIGATGPTTSQHLQLPTHRHFVRI
jgi:hypothetical protein